MQIAKFQTIAKLLSQEFIALNILRRQMDNALVDPDVDADDATAAIECVEDLRQRAFLLQQEIQASFSANSDARQNWFNLDEYISFFRYVKLNCPNADYDPQVALKFPPPAPVPVTPPKAIQSSVDPIPTPELDLLNMYLAYLGEDESSGRVANIEKGRLLADTIFDSDGIELQFDDVVAKNKKSAPLLLIALALKSHLFN